MTWLRNLKTGDRVILVERFTKPRYIVTYVTSNEGICINLACSTRKFSAHDGTLYTKTGSPYHAHLVEATPERLTALLEQRHRDRYIYSILRVNLHDLSTQTLKRLNNAIYGE
jgi:hypothetical protein